MPTVIPIHSECVATQVPARIGTKRHSEFPMTSVNVPNAMTPFDDVLCCGQPTTDALEDCRRKGIKTIINLRPATEQAGWDEAEAVEKLGLKYVNIPIASEGDLTRDNVAAFDRALKDNGAPAVVHCASGNRVGALFALRAAWIEGKGADEALDIGRRSGLTGMEPAVMRLLKHS